MEQTFIYEYIGVHCDPIFEMISALNEGQVIVIGNIKILLNTFNLYEVSTHSTHDSFRSLDSCYKRICELNGDYKVV